MQRCDMCALHVTQLVTKIRYDSDRKNDAPSTFAAMAREVDCSCLLTVQTQLSLNQTLFSPIVGVVEGVAT